MPDQADTGELAAELRVSVGRIIRRLRVEHVFPYTQAIVLGHLDREGPMGISDLAVAVRVRPQSMAQTVRELDDAGLVARRPDPDDRRRTFITLTDSGREVLAADRRHRDGWLARALAQLTEEERSVLHQAAPVLRRIADL